MNKIFFNDSSPLIQNLMNYPAAAMLKFVKPFGKKKRTVIRNNLLFERLGTA